MDEAGQNRQQQLQSEVDELRGQLEELRKEKETLMKRTKSAEDRQVRNWKWIQAATKFSGISVNKCSEKSCTFHFHPMWNSESLPIYSMKVNFTKKGYDLGPCFLPESIQLQDLDNTKPLDRLVWDTSNLVDSFAHRQQQTKELEELFGNSVDRFVSYSSDFLEILLRIRVLDDDHRSFMLSFHLEYLSDEILPNKVVLDTEEKISKRDLEDFEAHCTPFYTCKLVEAFRQAF